MTPRKPTDFFGFDLKVPAGTWPHAFPFPLFCFVILLFSSLCFRLFIKFDLLRFSLGVKRKCFGRRFDFI